jgi:hypothetical protein
MWLLLPTCSNPLECKYKFHRNDNTHDDGFKFKNETRPDILGENYDNNKVVHFQMKKSEVEFEMQQNMRLRLSESGNQFLLNKKAGNVGSCNGWGDRLR